MIPTFRENPGESEQPLGAGNLFSPVITNPVKNQPGELPVRYGTGPGNKTSGIIELVF